MSTFNQGIPSVSHLISTANCLIVGNTSSGNALSVQQLGAGNVASFRTTTGSTALFVSSAGNVGVGTVGPAANFHVYGSSPYRIVTDSSGATDAKSWWESYSGGNAVFYCANDANNASAQWMVVNRSGYTPQYISWLTGGAERMRIDVNGRVGINQTNPQTPLQITATASNSAIFIDNSLATFSARPLATNAGSANCHIWADGVANGLADAGFLRLAAGGGASNGNKSYIDLSGYSGVTDLNQNIVFGTQGTERMRITGGGNVGIGVTDPGVALQLGAVNNTTSALKIGNFSLQMVSYQGLFGTGTVTYTPSGSGLFVAYYAGDTMIFTCTFIGGYGQVSAVTTYMNAAALTGNGGYGQLSLSTSVGGVLTATYKSTGDYMRVFRMAF